jgi:hypothetical protein
MQQAERGLAYYYSMMMEVKISFETTAGFYQTTRSYIPEANILSSLICSIFNGNKTDMISSCGHFGDLCLSEGDYNGADPQLS